MEKRAQISELLLELERALRELDLWESRQFAPHELVSQMPFAVDILTFPQWLQFIFIVKMNQLLEQGMALPSVSGMEPMAQEYFKQASIDGGQVETILARIDRLLSEAG